MRPKSFLLAALLGTLALFGAACGGGDNPALEGPPTLEPQEETSSITADDQTSDGTQVVVASATIVGSDGFIVVHRDADGAPGEVVGHAPIPEGTSTNVTVTLDEPVETGLYWPMIHIDAGELGTYEFPGDDVPLKVDDQIVMVQITVTVES